MYEENNTDEEINEGKKSVKKNIRKKGVWYFPAKKREKKEILGKKFIRKLSQKI